MSITSMPIHNTCAIHFTEVTSIAHVMAEPTDTIINITIHVRKLFLKRHMEVSKTSQ